jgi:predicted transcriptional regulator
MTLASSILASLLADQQPPTTPAALNQLSRFKAKGWISVHGGKGNRTYALTNVGRIVAIVQVQQEATEAFIETHRDYLQSHDISGIPTHLLPRLGELKGILAHDNTETMATIQAFMQRVTGARWLKGVSGHVARGYTDAVGEIARRSAEIELVLTTDVIMELPETWLDGMLSLPNFRLYETETASVGLCCMDSGLSLGFPIGNIYDISSDLICGQEALLWGLDLFEWYKKHATPIEQTKHAD